MKLRFMLVKFSFLSLRNCFEFEEDGSGSEEIYIEASGSSEPISETFREIDFNDYELANGEDEVTLRGRDNLEIIQPEKFIGPQYLLTRQPSESNSKMHDISKVFTDMNEFISFFSGPSTSTVKFPLEADGLDDICSCECLKKYEYFHSSEENTSSEEVVKVVLKKKAGQEPCNEKQYQECCKPLVNGSPRFRFPASPEVRIPELEISESVIHSTNDKAIPTTTENSVQSVATLNHLLVEDVYSFVDLMERNEQLNATVPSMANWFILVDIKTSSRLVLTLSSRSKVGFLAKEGDKPFLKNFDILDQMDGVTRVPFTINLTPGSWYFRLTNEEHFDQEMLLDISHQPTPNFETSCCEDDCKIIFGQTKCISKEDQCIHGISESIQGGCNCIDGWLGRSCNISSKECSSSLCSGSGDCVHREDQHEENSISCICHEGFSGDKCEVLQCDLDCGLNGICSGGQCRCFEGWTGMTCNTQVKLSTETICLDAFMSEQGSR